MKNKAIHMKRLSRTPKHRDDLLKNLLASLVERERIETSVAKAKFIQFHANKLIDYAKNNRISDCCKLLSQPQKHIGKVIG